MIIDRYVSQEISRPLFAGLALLILIFVAWSAARYLGLAADGQLSMFAAFKLVGLNTLVALEILLPSALFFSVLAAMGRLYKEAEMHSFYAAGVGRMRFLESVLKYALVVALLTGFISIIARPWAYRTSYELEARAAAHYDLKKMAAGEFVELAGSDYVFYAGGVDVDNGEHRDVFLFKRHRKHRRAELLVARRATLPALNPDEPLAAHFQEGYNYLLDEARRRDLITRFGDLEVRLKRSSEQEKYRRKAETTAALSQSSDPKDIAEFQWRITTPLATVLLGLMAVPLAHSAPRASRIRNVFGALVVYIALFAMTSVMRTGIEQGTLGAMPGLWLAYVLEAVLLLFLVRKPGIFSR
ncbi:LPS export ABC transporter permease LptF [Mangrovimicrobium sediminis]|uniref:LPS export ABC transporter permease LptF n=1 Tax=Mangrovimicrobium sediminis TaxID=2562682 RepID=UPI001436BCE9|nr:LPS export ABC transporter permease LptF [Haliea sp. SAOS-164]